MEIVKKVECFNPEFKGKAIEFSMYEEGIGEKMHNIGLVREVNHDKVFVVLSDSNIVKLYLKDYKNGYLNIKVLA